LKSLLNKLRAIAERENLKAYLVGGFVRDLLLGVKNLDLDIVVEGDGIKFADCVANSFGAKITAHKQFGTATVFIKPGLKVDFSSARKEYYPKPAHLPVVSPGSLREDLFRRDFTINALAINLSDAKLVDYFGGQLDLKHKVIRVLHVLSFIDDPTRILRAIRFEQRYSFKIEPLTLRLLKEAVKLDSLGSVHPHRMRDELIPILKEKDPIKEIKRLERLTGFDFIHPGLRLTKPGYLFLRSIKIQVDWFNEKNVGRRPLDNWLIYLAGLLNSLDVPAIKKVCFKFGLRKGEESRLLSFKQMRISDIKYLSGTKIKPSKMFKLLKPLSYETIVALRAKYQNKIFRRNTASFLEIYNEMRISVCGEDLRCLGVLPGPRYQRIFEQVLAAKLNGQVKNKEEELILIKQLLKKRS
jgi:tRNA nucleotidyltransferase (CCA-adding enzyme)